MSRFYVYIHERADDGRVFYVGKGTGNRFCKYSKRSDWWKRVVAKHGLRHRQKVYVESDAEAQELERFLIAEFRESGAPLVNISDGGGGCLGYKFTPEQRAKMALPRPKISEGRRGKRQSAQTVAKRIESLRKRFATVPRHPVSEETRAKMSAAGSGRKVSPENIEKMRQRMRGFKHTPEVRQRMSLSARKAKSRSFICLENGRRFEALGDGVEWLRAQGFAKASKSSIYNALHRPGYTAYGFHFRWAEGEPQ